MEAPHPAPAAAIPPTGGAKLRIFGPRLSVADAGPSPVVVNTTSRSREAWSIGLSPFFLGPVPLWDRFTATNVENAWQYCKVYKEHLNDKGEPSENWYGVALIRRTGMEISEWRWAREGWANPKPVRFPMGRGAKPEYSYWNGKHLPYVEARKEIYAPLYAAAVVQTMAFQRLLYLYRTRPEVHLWDFDGYDFVAKRMSLNDVINEPRWKMGHAFVLAMLLRVRSTWLVETENELCWPATAELRAALAAVKPCEHPPLTGPTAANADNSDSDEDDAPRGRGRNGKRGRRGKK